MTQAPPELSICDVLAIIPFYLSLIFPRDAYPMLTLIVSPLRVARIASGAPYVAIVQDSRALLGNFTNHVFMVYYAEVSKPKTASQS